MALQPRKLNGFLFQLYSKLTDQEKTKQLREFLNDFSISFGLYEDVMTGRGNWRRGLDKIFMETSPSISLRDMMLASVDDVLVAAQGFSFSEERKEAYDEGVFVDKNFRGNGLALILSRVFLAYLKDKGLELFYVGKKGPYSARVRRSVNPQRLARRTIDDAGKAVIEVVNTPKMKLISSYTIDLKLYRPRYDISGMKFG